MANPTGNQKQPPSDQTPQQKPKFSRGLLSWMLICFVLIMMWGMINGPGKGTEIKSWNDFIDHATAGQFEDNRVIIEESKVVATIANTTTPVGSTEFEEGTIVYFPYGGQSQEWYLAQLNGAGIDHTTDIDSGILMTLLVSWAPMLIILFLIFFFSFCHCF